MDPQEKVYEAFYHYDFNSDEGYKQGLQQVYEQYIDMHNQQNPTEQITVDGIDKSAKSILSLQAKVFFFCQKTGDILSLDDYEVWKSKYESHSRPVTDTVTETAAEAPPYSSNYEHLVNLIMNNQPVPGIKQIPNVVLDPSTGSKHVLKERKKPWEVAEPTGGEEAVNETTSTEEAV
ncbi:unnamed protein product [Kuraishia capsulata CBS 1993]|uniref:Uncharacterized protein n=1 Tax=Kuraishia capsulata CBS 1993 TaxID=1382522 RepID=W6MRB5_9ASCO|nr:uncharacterized protein KUCA_T00003771001 [Kuraishia capsulata CBS 1993]CDK27792.1 unnamed protein product [Kuraishia capsulata CBS 1993]